MVLLHSQTAALSLSLSLSFLPSLISGAPTNPPYGNSPPSGGNYNHHQHQSNGYGYGPYAPNPVPDYTANPHEDWVVFTPSGASPGFKCYYPYLSNKEWEGCNEPGNRGCWIRKRGGFGGGDGYSSDGEGYGHGGGGGYGHGGGGYGHGGGGYGHGGGGYGHGGGGYGHGGGGYGHGGGGYGGYNSSGYGSDGYGSGGGRGYGGGASYGRGGGRYGWDVHTDYDDFAPVGVRRYYTYNVATKTIAPDGVPKEAVLFDGLYPGPLLEGCWGDELVITVVNSLPNQGTTVHWHGIRQLYTNDMDGVPVTQCPIAREDSFVYKFRLTQYGASWYHSHYSLQYADGLAAPMLIYGPSSANYDVTTKDVLVVTDWVHGKAEEAYQDEKNPVVRGASTDSILLNGVGQTTPYGVARKFANNDIRTAYPVTTVYPGKKNRFFLINTSVATAFVFSIDGHNFTVINNDFVAVKPYTVNSIVVAIGQRYEIIINGLDQPNLSGNYWIRTQPANGCNRFKTGFFNTLANPPSLPFDVRTGVLHYSTPHSKLTALPTSLSTVTNFDCADLAVQSSLIPVVPWHVKKPINKLAASTLYAAHQTAVDTGLGELGEYAHWLLRLDPKVERQLGISPLQNKPFWIEFADPTLLNLNTAPQNPYYNVLQYSSRDRDGFIYMVIDGALLPSTTPADVNGTFIIPPIAHPMHWHGSDVVILGQSNEPFDPVTSPKTWNFNNPPRRDTVTMPSGGYVAVAFKPDNPGVWLVHCHIAWHASAGLALQMIIQDDPRHIYNVLGQSAVNELREGCKSWNRDLFRQDLQPILHKDDSGI